MEPSDIDGPKDSETPGEMLARLLVESNVVRSKSVMTDLCYLHGYADLDAIASAFKAAVLKGEV